MASDRNPGTDQYTQYTGPDEKRPDDEQVRGVGEDLRGIADEEEDEDEDFEEIGELDEEDEDDVAR